MIGKILNNRFGKAYVKNLHNSKERMRSFENSSKLVCLEYTRVEAIDGTRFIDQDYSFQHGRFHITYPSSAGFWGNQITSAFITMQEISINSNSFMLFDDDSVFNQDFSYLNTDDFNVPDNWDVIILGGINKHISNKRDIEYRRLSDPSHAAGSHALCINSTVYRDLYNMQVGLEIWGDGIIASFIEKGKLVYMVEPHIVYQDRELYSDINKIYHKD